MANYNTVITNEGAALLASVIANHGTITFTNLKLSENDYTGQEATLTEGTFDGIFANVSVASSIVDITTIKVSATVHGYNFSGDHNLYALGVIGTDGNTTALIAICTTTNPDVLRDNSSTYAFNINLTVSSTSNITVVGTTAAALYTTDIVDNLTSTATDKPLSANMGRVLNENVEAIVDVYGAKNQLDDDDYLSLDNMDKSGHTFTSNNTDSRNYFDFTIDVWDGTTFIQTLVNETVASTGHYEYSVNIPNNANRLRVFHNGSQRNISVLFNTSVTGACIISLDVTGVDPTTVGGLSFENIMIRDDRITDPTYEPYAKTNQQLTADKAERSDLATLNLTGSTNTTGVTITNGTFFYLNGQFCKALADIAANATFTLNTNYKEDTVGAEIKAVENKDTSSFSVSTESGVSLQKAICRNGFVYLQLFFAALANSTKIATITDANYLPEGGMAVGLIEPDLSAEKINYTYGSFSGSNVYVYVSGSPTSGGIITFVYPVTGY